MARGWVRRGLTLRLRHRLEVKHKPSDISEPFHAQPLSLVKDILTGLRESSDAFPPLKSAVGGVLYIVSLVEVQLPVDGAWILWLIYLHPQQVKSNKKQAEGLAKRAAELIVLLTDLIDEPDNMPLDMYLALERFNKCVVIYELFWILTFQYRTLTAISEFMMKLSNMQGMSRYLDRKNHQEQLRHYSICLNEAEIDFHVSSCLHLAVFKIPNSVT
jgi:hypothetical protein